MTRIHTVHQVKNSMPWNRGGGGARCERGGGGGAPPFPSCFKASEWLFREHPGDGGEGGVQRNVVNIHLATRHFTAGCAFHLTLACACSSVTLDDRAKRRRRSAWKNERENGFRKRGARGRKARENVRGGFEMRRQTQRGERGGIFALKEKGV
jgi:hypothetical protein